MGELEQSGGILGAGFRLVLRHQRVLWWLFAVNFTLGGLGAGAGAARRLSDVLAHSLAGQQLSKGFDLGMFLELVQQPEVRLFQGTGASFIAAGLFLLFMLFVTGGILAVYRRNTKLTTAEFFAASGGYFWPMVRLALWSLIPLTILNFLYDGVSKLSDKIGDAATDARTGFVVLVIGCIPILLLFVWVRMWFDLAQVRSVALENRVMRRNAIAALSLSGRSFNPLYWDYLITGVVTWAVTIVCLVIWAKLPPTALPATFVLLEMIMLTHIGARLWQKACATAWYARNPEAVHLTATGPVTFSPYETERPDTPLVADIDRPLSGEVEPGPPIVSDRTQEHSSD